MRIAVAGALILVLSLTSCATHADNVVARPIDGRELSENASPPVLTYRPPLTYPESARRNEIEGTVILSILVGVAGDPVEVVVIEGTHPLLDRRAERWGRRLRFDPAMHNGEPVNMWLQVPVEFALE